MATADRKRRYSDVEVETGTDTAQTPNLISANSNSDASASTKRKYSRIQGDSGLNAISTPNPTDLNAYSNISLQTGAQAHLGDIHQTFHSGVLTAEQQCHQIFKTSPYERYKNINPVRLDGTCEWVLKHPNFQAWRQNKQDSLLWISADPGCGKSVLSKSLVDRDLKQDGSHESICYFFFKDNKEQDNTATGLCALLHQLYTHQPDLLHHAVDEWKRSGTRLQQETQELWRILRRSVADPLAKPVICVLDALDECIDQDRRELIQMFCDIQKDAPRSETAASLKIVVTSRPYSHVQRYFDHTISQWPEIHLRGEVENDKINQEIDLVITKNVEELVSEYSLSETACARLRDQLVNKQNRTYLWLHLVMEEVRQAYADSLYPDDVQLPLLPTSVEDAYERILQKVSSTQRSNARRVLSIMLAAWRALTVEEMASALGAAQCHQFKEPSIRQLNSQHLTHHIRQWCGLCIFIQHEKLFFVHQTAKEFLLSSDNGIPNNPTVFRSSFVLADMDHLMANICTTYLLKEHTNYTSHLNAVSHPEDFPDHDSRHFSLGFWEYCASYWTEHAKDEYFRKDSDLLRRAIVLYDVTNVIFDSWYNTWCQFQIGPPDPHDLVHLVAHIGHVEVLRELYHRTAFDLDAIGSTKMAMPALAVAARNGHENMVKWLLRSGARDLDAALLQAIFWGHESIVRILLDAGAGKSNVRMLFEHESIVRILLDAGACKSDVRVLFDAGAGQSDTVLGHALRNEAVFVEASKDSIVKMLVEAGAGGFERALSVAVESGNCSTVRIPLEAGADVDKCDFEGNPPVVSALLRRGVSMMDNFKKFGSTFTPFDHWPSESILRILLEAGVDVNIRGRKGSALQEAEAIGNSTEIQMLVDAGAQRS